MAVLVDHVSGASDVASADFQVIHDVGSFEVLLVYHCLPPRIVEPKKLAAQVRVVFH